MKHSLLCLALVASTALAMDKPAMTEADAFRAVDAGACGMLPLGTGLVGGKGWLHQPIPGPVEVRATAGTIRRIGGAPAASIVIDMDAGRPYYVETTPGTTLTWKVPGFAWGEVPVGFQLPPMKTIPR